MSATMQSLVLHAVGKLTVEERPVPIPAAGELLVKVAFCGVCGSDLPRLFVKGTYHFPTVCGHEFAGTVTACGEGVTDLPAGAPVAVFPLLWCGRCPACEQGRFVMCRDYDYYGSRRDGGFSGYVAVPRRNVIPVPAGVSLEEAAMTEPAAVALHAVRRAGVSPVGAAAAVFGAGPIGLMTAQWLRAMGAQQVLLFDIVPEKLELARRLGFGHAYDSRTADSATVIRDLTQERGADFTFDAAGVPVTLLQAMTATAAGGHLVLLGNPAAAVTLPPALISQLMRREVTLHGTWNSDYSQFGHDDWSAALHAMADGRLQLKPLISQVVPLAAAEPVLRAMHAQTGFFSKVLIQP
jgi:L-iditol 2-dehydrogenase